jgi:Zn-dependent M28 family amino/carboxypeptidase
MKTVVSLMAVVLFYGSLAVDAQAQRRAAVRHVDRAQLLSDMTTLADPALEGRAAGSAGSRRARQWIVKQFAAIGLRPGRGTAFEQSFSLAQQGGRRLSAANVVGGLPGTNAAARTIVVTAHYDHLGVRNGVVYPGADDNASGVAVLLAVARHFRTTPPRHALVFAALDAEEAGLQGARTLVGSDWLPRTVALNVNLDMVARSGSNDIYAAGSYHSPWQVPILRDVQPRSAVNILFGHDRPAAAADGLDDWTHQSDHGPFHDTGIPFVYFGVEDHADYHGPTDTADRIDPRFFGDAADMIVEAVRTFDMRLP